MRFCANHPARTTGRHASTEAAESLARKSPRVLMFVVTQIGPVGATSGQYFPVVILIVRPAKALAGMTARVALVVASPEALTVPQGAVEVDQGRAWVWVIEEGKAHKTEVGLGLSDGRVVQIVRGLKPDQIVAFTNVTLLTEGAAVTVQP